MARIPVTVANRSLDTGSVVSYPSGSPIGAAISGLGGALQGVAERVQQQNEQKDSFDAKIREQEMIAQLSSVEDETAQNAPADGKGIHDSVYGELDPVTQAPVKPGSFDKLFDDYLQRIPESKRGEFAAKREVYRLQGSNRLARVEYDSQQKYYQVEIQKTQNQITTSMAALDPNDDQTFETFKAEGLDIIEKSGLPALEKDVARENWLAKADEALFKTKLAKDPAFAEQARAALGLAPVATESTDTNPVASVVDRIIGAESSGDPNAQNSRSSAGWVATIRKHRPDLARGMSNDDIIGLKTDGALNREMTTRHTEDNAKGLEAAGIPASAANIYLAHFAGLDGAKAILSADDDTAVSDVLSASAIKANPQLAGKSVADMKTWSARKMGRMSPGAGPAPNVKFIDATKGKIRDKPVKGWVKDGLARAAAATDPRIAIKIVSGGQDDKQRTGSTRHDHGNAADLILVVDGKEVRPSENKALYAAFFKNAAANGFKGLGHYEWGIHVGGGGQAIWGPDKTSQTLDPEFAKAAAEGWGNPAKGGTSPASDPRFANIPLDRRLVLANQADVQVNEINSARKAEFTAAYTQHKDALELQIVQGQIRDEKLIASDTTLNDGDKATLIRTVRTQNEGANQIASDFSALQDRTLTLDPYGSKDKTRADNLYSDAVKRLPAEQHGVVAGAILEQTGVVPQPVINSIRKGLSSTNASDVATAAQIAQRIASFDPAALARRDGGSDVQTAADDFTFYVNKMNMTPEEAAQRLIEKNDPEKKFTRKAIEPAAKEYLKEIEKTDLSATFGTWFATNPDVGFTEGQRLGIQAEFAAIAEDQFYRSNGDPEVATNRAVEQMKRLYGVTELTGRRVIMKHPPERYWPKLPVADAAQSMSYPVQLQNDIREIAPNADMSSVELVTTPETDAMVKRGEMPGYAVLFKDENGVMQTIPGKLWMPEVGKLLEMQQKIDDTTQQKKVDAARAAQPQERAKAPYNVQKMDDFLGGADPVFGDR